MVSQIHVLSLLTTLLPFLLLLSKPCKILATENIIAKTCHLTQFPQDCVSNLESDPRSSGADLTGLSRIALELSTTKVNNNATELFNFLQNATDYPTWSFFQTCFLYYNTSVYQITPESIVAFDEKKYDKTYQILDATNKAIVDCKNLGHTVGNLRVNDINTMNYRFINDTMTILHQLF
ncbi:hypothetical protein Pint_21199 [Pistacia integerrima]|uniref:Uncharacterized protein n=1 Tax=Pistacia integerrima TaxID=434235 RepID=A0ACC0XBE6_9ROSI|nr:hypothetical protein Pint_21199 [Pistacia integerrima]